MTCDRDVCATCGREIATLRNVVVIGREDGLATTWMPPEGCTCAGVVEADANPDCRRCYPPALWCQPCGDAATNLQMSLSFTEAS